MLAKKRPHTAFIQNGRLIVDFHRKQARSYRF